MEKNKCIEEEEKIIVESVQLISQGHIHFIHFEDFVSFLARV